jgi:hypothetical protein
MKPICKLIGEDSNIFNLLTKVLKILRNEGLNELADECRKKICNSESYEDALSILGEYVEIE